MRPDPALSSRESAQRMDTRNGPIGGKHMAFDGITTAAVVHELNMKLAGGGISRIVQSEKDELVLTVKSRRQTYRVLMSASASLPLLYLIPANKQAPLTAPNFCMLLRKHLQGGQITRIYQPSLERVVIFEVSHRDELGDLATKNLIIELMGKYSNIILTDNNNKILDSIKRVPASISSVREVLPGRDYFIPGADEKKNPLEADAFSFRDVITSSPHDVVKALYMSYTGLSPIVSEEFAYEAGILPRKKAAELSEDETSKLYRVFGRHMDAVKMGLFEPQIVFADGIPKDFATFPLNLYTGSPEKVFFEEEDLSTVSDFASESGYSSVGFESPSDMLISYYGEKDASVRIRQKSADLRHVITTALDRTNKKFALQEKQLLQTEKKDKYRIYGEMLNTYGYNVPEGAKSIEVINYYTNEPLTIPLDPQLSPRQNSQKYFDRYAKLKRTADALATQIEETRADAEQLEYCLAAIDMAETEGDLVEIRRELGEFGFMQKKSIAKGKAREAKAKPLVFISSDGFTMYVGRNNYQNEEVTFKIGSGSDWWFHAKKMPGSHVIVKTDGRELTDRTYEEAGALAAYYSSGRKAPKVEIDYTERRNLRKKNGGKPGFVTYHTNYSLMATPDISSLRRV